MQSHYGSHYANACELVRKDYRYIKIIYRYHKTKAPLFRLESKMYFWEDLDKYNRYIGKVESNELSS